MQQPLKLGAKSEEVNIFKCEHMLDTQIIRQTKT